MTSGKWRPFCLSLYVLRTRDTYNIPHISLWKFYIVSLKETSIKIALYDAEYM